MKMTKYIALIVMVTANGVSGALCGMSAADEQALRWQAGQLLMVGFDGTTADETSTIITDLRSLNVGGIILFAKNITGAEQLKGLTAQLHKQAPTPVMIAVDAEGGKVNRLNPEFGFLKVPSAFEMGSCTADQTLAVSRALASQLAALGINVNLAPVVDIHQETCPVIGALKRAFSADPAKIIEHAKVFIAGHREMGVATALKHFLGHGGSTKDSHKGLVDVTETYRPEVELLPFAHLIKEGVVDMVMTAHIMNRNIDPTYPATLSLPIITGLLRETLGFDGVVITDDLGMGAIVKEYSFQEVVVRAVAAGCDMLILARNSTGVLAHDVARAADAREQSVARQAVDALCQAVKDGRLSADRVAEAARRVEKLKKTLKIIT